MHPLSAINLHYLIRNKALEHLSKELYKVLQSELFLWIQIICSRLIFQKLSNRQSLKAAIA
jgi:hypothetical protein